MAQDRLHVAHLGTVVEHPASQRVPEVVRSRLDAELLGVLADDQPDRLSLQAPALTIWPRFTTPALAAKGGPLLYSPAS
jgi:hypothetical protein